VISEAEVHELFDRFDRALARTHDWVRSQGFFAQLRS
jgi:hypothetical protein